MTGAAGAGLVVGALALGGVPIWNTKKQTNVCSPAAEAKSNEGGVKGMNSMDVRKVVQGRSVTGGY